MKRARIKKKGKKKEEDGNESEEEKMRKITIKELFTYTAIF